MSTILPWLIWDRQGDLLQNGHGIIPKTSKYLVRRCLNPQTSSGSKHLTRYDWRIWMSRAWTWSIFMCSIVFFCRGSGACFCWPKGFRARILDARFGDLIWLWLFDLNSSKISWQWWWHYLLTQLFVVVFSFDDCVLFEMIFDHCLDEHKKQIYRPNAFNWSKSSKSLWGVFCMEIQQWNAATQEGEVHQL